MKNVFFINSKQFNFGFRNSFIAGYFAQRIPPISVKGYHLFRSKDTTRYGESIPLISGKGYLLLWWNISTNKGIENIIFMISGVAKRHLPTFCYSITKGKSILLNYFSFPTIRNTCSILVIKFDDKLNCIELTIPKYDKIL